jgi:hypothetical protein
MEDPAQNIRWFGCAHRDVAQASKVGNALQGITRANAAATIMVGADGMLNSAAALLPANGLSFTLGDVFAGAAGARQDWLGGPISAQTRRTSASGLQAPQRLERLRLFLPDWERRRALAFPCG